jgi:hypothetical protein
MYALAASAASVGVLASAQSAEAKIVYTNAQQHIGVNGNYAVDLNHDGVADFLIQQWPGGFVGYTVGALFAKAALGNAIQSGDAALRLGQEIGPSQRFVSTTRGYGETMVWAERTKVPDSGKNTLRMGALDGEGQRALDYSRLNWLCV